MRRSLSGLLIVLLLFGGAITTTAQELPCTTESLDSIYNLVLTATDYVNQDQNDQAVEALIQAREQLTEFITRCGDPAIVADRLSAPIESTPAPAAELVTLTADGVTLRESYVAPDSQFTVNLPGDYEVEEDVQSIGSASVLQVGLNPTSGTNSLPNTYPLSIIYGEPSAVLRWSGLVDRDNFTYEGLESLETVIREMPADLREGIGLTSMSVYPISVGGSPGVAASLGVTIPVDDVPTPYHALLYYVPFDETHLALFASITEPGELDALIPTLNAIALSFKAAD